MGVALIGAALAGAPTAVGQALSLTRCTDDPDVRCGSIAVPLDHAAPAGEELFLQVRVVPGAPRPRGTVAILAGGPGQPAITPGDGFEETVASAAPGYRIVVLNQRGTGAGALRCSALETATDITLGGLVTAAPAVARCAEQVGPRRVRFTTTDSVADLDMLRTALGVPRWTLLGVSYGTVVATAYARTHPAATERLVLDSVVGPDGNEVVEVDSFAAARRMLADLCGGTRCRRVTGNPVSDVAALEARLQAGGVPGLNVDRRGRTSRGVFGGPSAPDALFDLLGSGDLNPAVRAGFPAAVRSALRGDATSLLRLGRGDDGDDDPAQFSVPLLLATVCQETRLPWTPDQALDQRLAALRGAIAARPAETFAPFRPPSGETGVAAACLGWPEAPREPLTRAPLPDVPTLMLVGGHDLRTPRETAARLAAELPRTQTVVVRGEGHSVITGHRCASVALRTFLAGRTATRACRGIDQRPDVAPVPPASLDAVRAVGVAGRRGRTLQAVRLTIRDLPLAIGFARASGDSIVFEGLRGGTAELSLLAGAVDMKRYRYVPGVDLTGQLDLLGPEPVLTVRVGGTAAARGTLRIGDDRAVGTLGGRPVDVPFSLSPG